MWKTQTTPHVLAVRIIPRSAEIPKAAEPPAQMVMTKEKLSRGVAEKTAELYMSGMTYEKALEKAKFILKNSKM